MAIDYDYEAKGKADYEAGRRDNKLYDNPADNGVAYRKGWQGARRAEPWGGSAPGAPPPALLRDRPPPVANNLAKGLETPKKGRPKPEKPESDQLSFL